MASQIGLKYGLEGGKVTSGGLYSLGTSLGGPSVAISSTISSYLKMDTVKEGLAIGLSLSLLRTDGAANILSEPTILCSNNKESSIYVGKTQSILKSSSTGTNATDLTRNSYSREDIGITLKVKPRLSSNNKVTLSIEAIIEDVLGGSGSLSDRPTTTKRKVITNAIVNNGETIIVGGLIKKSAGKGTTKVPLLGDIPIIGELFRSTSDSDSSVNVVIYITPYIVRKSGDLQKLRKMLSELDTLQIKYNSLVYKGLEKRLKNKGSSGRIGQSTTASTPAKPLHPASNRIHFHDDEESDTIFIPGQ
jgi:general secretion pathway protein D